MRELIGIISFLPREFLLFQAPPEFERGAGCFELNAGP
jgi:hypothetical protein